MLPVVGRAIPRPGSPKHAFSGHGPGADRDSVAKSSFSDEVNHVDPCKRTNAAQEQRTGYTWQTAVWAATGSTPQRREAGGAEAPGDAGSDDTCTDADSAGAWRYRRDFISPMSFVMLALASPKSIMQRSLK